MLIEDKDIVEVRRKHRTIQVLNREHTSAFHIQVPESKPVSELLEIIVEQIGTANVKTVKQIDMSQGNQIANAVEKY